MKKLTTKQKLYNFWNNEKFKKARDIILFVSLGINLLIFILFGVVSCSTDSYKSDSIAKTDNTQLVVKNKKQLNLSDLVDNSIYQISMPLYIPNGYAGGTVYYTTHDYGVYVHDDLQYHEEQVKAYKGDTIRRTTWFNNDERTNFLTFTFYDYAGSPQLEAHYSQGVGNNFYQSDDWALGFIYLAYNTYNHNFFNYLLLIGANFQFVNTGTFTFAENWSIFDYINSNDGMSDIEYTASSARFLINNSNFYINGTRYNFMYFEFGLPGSFSLMGSTADQVGYINYQGSIVTAQISNYLNWDTFGPYRYIFKGLYVGRLGDSSSLLQIASPKYAVGNVRTSANPLDIKLEIAGTIEFTHDTYHYITLTGSNFVDYIEAPLFAFNYNEETGVITLNNQPNDNAVSYLNYSYSVENDIIPVIPGGDSNNTTNVITLIASAFTGLTNFFGIMVLPGITLGLLLFMPLVVSIIVLVFRAVKK